VKRSLQAYPPLTDAASGSSASAPPRAFTVLVLTVAYMHSNVARQAVPMFVGTIQRDLGLSDVGISLVGGLAFVLFYSVVGVPLGRLVDRVNRRRLILWGIVFWTAMTALCGVSTSLALFLIGRIGLGISEAAVVPASLSMFHDLVPRERLALAVNTFFTGVWLGNGLAYILGAFVLALAGGAAALDIPVLGPQRPWQIAFLVVAIAGLPVLLLCLPLREPPRSVPHAGSGESGAVSSPRTPLREVLSLSVREPRLYVCLFAGVTLYSAAVSGTAFWAVEYFVRVFGTDRGHISYIYGLQGVFVGSGGLVASGWLAD
jgi:MFS family permease